MVTTVYTLCLIILWNCVKSQSNNDTNETFIPTTTDIITTTQFFTSIDIVTTGDPTIDPTIEPTSDPTSISTTLYTTTADPIYERYTGFVEASMIDANGNSAPIQYSSFPVNYEPYQYTLYNETFFHMLDEVINPCDVSSIISKYNASDIDGKIVGLDARSINSKYESVLGDCNYQQWTLNIESLGAKGVLLGVNKPFRNYAGDNSLSTPTIPTRFIDIDDLTNFAFSLDIGGIVQILVTLEAFENEYPAR